MGKKNEKKIAPAPPPDPQGFPETQTEVLSTAARGDWEPFFQEYLRPCWQEVVIACRSHHLPIEGADDLFQELILRLIRDARFGPRTRQTLAGADQDPGFRASLPGRYLKYRELPVQSARFRTLLKNVIHNLVREAVRNAHRQPVQLDGGQWAAWEPSVEQSITRSLDRRWMIDCLAEAAGRLLDQSKAARTRGRQRLFDILFLSTVEGQSPGHIAVKYDVDRSTISGLLREARARFVALLGEITGLTDPGELRDLLAGAGSELRDALTLAHADAQDRAARCPAEGDRLS